MQTSQMSSAVIDRSAPARSLERIRGISYEDFVAEYLTPRRPVIIEDAFGHWAAMRRWTPEFWIRTYGDRQVEIDGKPYSLKEVVELAQQESPETPPPYYRNVPLGRVYPELRPDISPPAIYSEPNWFHSGAFAPLRESFLGYGQYELFIGGAGRSFPYLHFDVPGTHTFIHQLAGHKLFILYPPGDAPYLYPKGGVSFNISRIRNVDEPVQAEFPLFVKATRYEVTIGPGDLLFFPCGWWHTARMLDYSVSLAIDVANDTNWKDVMGFIGHKAKMKIGPLSRLYVAYLWLVGKYLSHTSRVAVKRR